MIKNLKADENNWFLEGTFDSDSLFQGEMSVSIFTDDGATVEDAEACIAQYQQLKKNAAFCANLQEMLAAYFLYMYDALKEMGIYDEIVVEIEPVKQGYEAGENLLSYLSNPTLLVYLQEMDEIGYGIECDCPWEPEHSCLILVRNEKLLYVGESDGLDPWGEAEDYHCIWES